MEVQEIIDVKEPVKTGGKEYMREYMRDYIKNGKEIICDCGGKFKNYNKCIHKKTKRHIKHEEMKRTGTSVEIQQLKDEVETLKKLLESKPKPKTKKPEIVL